MTDGTARFAAHFEVGYGWQADLRPSQGERKGRADFQPFAEPVEPAGFGSS
jgi:hypothetical protein